MAKRFFETELWKEAWFRKLTPKYKLFWHYIHGQCDQAGIWPIDYDLASIFIGESIEEMDVRELFKDHIIPIDDEKLLLKNFIRFQYGDTLNPNSGPQKKVITILKSNTLNGFPLIDSLLDTLSVTLSDAPKE